MSCVSQPLARHDALTILVFDVLVKHALLVHKRDCDCRLREDAEGPRADRAARLALVKLAALDRFDHVARAVDQIKEHEELARRHDTILHGHDVFVA